MFQSILNDPAILSALATFTPKRIKTSTVATPASQSHALTDTISLPPRLFVPTIIPSFSIITGRYTSPASASSPSAVASSLSYIVKTAPAKAIATPSLTPNLSSSQQSTVPIVKAYPQKFAQYIGAGFLITHSSLVNFIHTDTQHPTL